MSTRRDIQRPVLFWVMFALVTVIAGAGVTFLAFYS